MITMMRVIVEDHDDDLDVVGQPNLCGLAINTMHCNERLMVMMNRVMIMVP